MIIMKFGSSCLYSAEAIQTIAEIVKHHLPQTPILVLSALAKTTDNVFQAAENAYKNHPSLSSIRTFHSEIIQELGLQKNLLDELLKECESLLKGVSLLKELTPKTFDQILSFGERFAVRIFAAYLNKIKIDAFFADAWEIGIKTSSHFMQAEILPQSYEAIQSYFTNAPKGVPVITGYIGKDCSNHVTTLGRGGSDLTASVLGAALKAQEIQLWKNVDGILSADPRVVEDAKPLKYISYAEASELAFFGAKILHPSSIIPAMTANIPVRIKNHFKPEAFGTLILKESPSSERLVGIAHKSNQVLVHITSTRMLGQAGFLQKIFEVFRALNFSVDIIATSEVSVSITLSFQKRLSELEEKLKDFAHVKISKDRSALSLIGNHIHSSSFLENIMHALAKENIDVEMISHGASKINTSLVMESHHIQMAIKILHHLFFTSSSDAETNEKSEF